MIETITEAKSALDSRGRPEATADNEVDVRDTVERKMAGLIYLLCEVILVDRWFPFWVEIR
jgi:hypothetical protein